jgi:hypothetical protein
MTQPSPKIAGVELYPDEATAGVGGRLAFGGAGEWLVERLGLDANFIRVASGSPVAKGRARDNPK